MNEQPAAEPVSDPPPESDPPVQREQPAAEPPEQETPPEQTPADPEPAPVPAPRGSSLPVPAVADSYNFTSIFIGALGSATQYVGAPSVAGPRGYGGSIIAGLLLGGYVEVGGQAGGESVSQDGAFGTGSSAAIVLTYSGFGGLYSPALGVGGASVRLGARGGWGSGSARVTIADQTNTVDIDTGVFVEPVLRAGFGSLGLIGAFRYFVDDTSVADWTASFGIIWGS